MVAGKEGVDVHQIQKSDFCLEVQLFEGNVTDTLWIIFVYASTEAHERERQ